MKRLLDIGTSALMLIGVFPLMLLFALLVKLDSNGPVFYRQLRVGLNARRAPRRFFRRRRRPTPAEIRRQQERRAQTACGRPFEVIKFRTMTVDAEPDGKPTWCQPNDPRVTRVGRILRKTHLDELPQLINIIRGEMSIVGPRPERPEFVATLSEKIPSYRARLALKPGLTGLAQISHNADLILNDVRKKIRYDFLYMKRASLSTDLKIIFGTVPLMLGFSLPKVRGLRKARRFLNSGKSLRLLHGRTGEA